VLVDRRFQDVNDLSILGAAVYGGAGFDLIMQIGRDTDRESLHLLHQKLLGLIWCLFIPKKTFGRQWVFSVYSQHTGKQTLKGAFDYGW